MNRYDKDGKIAPLIVAIGVGAILGGAFNVATNWEKIIKGGNINWGKLGQYAAVGAFAGGAAGAGGFGLAAAGVGTGFTAGAIVGGGAGALNNFGNQLVDNGWDFKRLDGDQILINGVAGAITGGLIQGGFSYLSGRDFFSGAVRKGATNHVSQFARKVGFKGPKEPGSLNSDVTNLPGDDANLGPVGDGGGTSSDQYITFTDRDGMPYKQHIINDDAVVANIGPNDDAVVANIGQGNGSFMITVGRWMSRGEYEMMAKTGRMMEGAGGQTFVTTGGSGSFNAAPNGSVYAEFQVSSNSLLKGGNANWLKVIGPNAGKAMQGALRKQGGEFLPQIQNLSPILKIK